MLGAGDIAVNKLDKMPALGELTISKQNNDSVWLYIMKEINRTPWERESSRPS